MELTKPDEVALRVVLVDDHPLMRASVRRSLEDRGGVDIVGEAGTGADALALIERTHADMVLLDLMLPDMDGIEVLGAMRRNGSSASVVILTGVCDPYTARAALEAGACGYLTKDRADPETLAEVVNTARLGLFSMDQRSMAAAVDRSADSGVDEFGLTPREREVWTLVTDGLSNAQIAGALFISERTAKFHVGNLLAKTGSRSRNQVTALAFRRGLVTAESWRTGPIVPAP